jgi:hypothetical protein
MTAKAETVAKIEGLLRALLRRDRSARYAAIVVHHGDGIPDDVLAVRRPSRAKARPKSKR